MSHDLETVPGISSIVKLILQLVWILSGTVTRAVTETQALMQEHTAQSARVENKIDKMQENMDILIQIEKFACVHASHNGNERGECFEASKR